MKTLDFSYQGSQHNFHFEATQQSSSCPDQVAGEVQFYNRDQVQSVRALKPEAYISATRLTTEDGEQHHLKLRGIEWNPHNLASPLAWQAD